MYTVFLVKYQVFLLGFLGAKMNLCMWILLGDNMKYTDCENGKEKVQ